MKKRMISLVLALAMCLSLCTTVFADPGASVEEKMPRIAPLRTHLLLHERSSL